MASAAADAQGGPLARLLVGHPDPAAAVFAFLTPLDALPLRAACRGFRGAAGGHRWALLTPGELSVPVAAAGVVRSPAGLARWRACYPSGGTLVLQPRAAVDSESLTDADLAPLGGCGLAALHLVRLPGVTAAGLAAAVASPTLVSLSLEGLPQLTGGDVAAATRGAPRLRVLRILSGIALADADLAGWGRLTELTLETRLPWAPAMAFTGAGFAHLAQVRSLTVLTTTAAGYPDATTAATAWMARRGVFARLSRLLALTLVFLRRSHLPMPQLAGDGGLFDGLPACLRRVHLESVALTRDASTDGPPDDGGAALLRPLAGVADVTLRGIRGLSDAGVGVLAGATRLELSRCANVVGGNDALAPLAARLAALRVKGCSGFTGAALGRLVALERLEVAHCAAFPDAAAFPGLASGCPLLRTVIWDTTGITHTGGDEAQAAARAAAEAALAGGTGPPGGAHPSRREWSCQYTEATRTWRATRLLCRAQLLS